MKSIDWEMRKHIPSYTQIKKAAQMNREKKQTGSRRKPARLTEISRGTGKPVLCQGVGVARAARKLYEYEEIGLTAQEIRALLERERNLVRRIEKLEGWE